jgi:hypothetical protein
MIRVWLGQLEAERGHHESAVRYLASVIYSLPAAPPPHPVPVPPRVPACPSARN